MTLERSSKKPLSGEGWLKVMEVKAPSYGLLSQIKADQGEGNKLKKERKAYVRPSTNSACHPTEVWL